MDDIEHWPAKMDALLDSPLSNRTFLLGIAHLCCTLRMIAQEEFETLTPSIKEYMNSLMEDLDEEIERYKNL